MSMSIEQRKAASDRMKAMHAKKKAEKLASQASEAPTPPVADPTPQVAPDQSIADLQKQVMEMQAAMIKMMGDKGGTSLGGDGRVLGIIEKYTVDPAQYPSPIERLMNEPRLQPMAFNMNYALYYRVDTSNYETKSGVNYKEPKFMISLARRVLDDQGNPVVETDPKTSQTGEKQYGVKNMIFHEDPQASIVIAREHGIDMDDYKDMDNVDEIQKRFLSEMRYLRVRDWLFDVFWSKPSTSGLMGQREEVIGGKIVPVFLKSSEESTGVDFDKIDGKLRV